jgi:hypothetical protein
MWVDRRADTYASKEWDLCAHETGERAPMAEVWCRPWLNKMPKAQIEVAARRYQKASLHCGRAPYSVVIVFVISCRSCCLVVMNGSLITARGL